MAFGDYALFFNTTGHENTATGFDTLFANTTGYLNTANGDSALLYNTSGFYNVADGANALFSNTTGNSNTANGTATLYSNTTGSSNTATGAFALQHNRTGTNNMANGNNALFTNKTGINNNANGSGALFSNRFGSHNTADGFNALYNNKTGAFNIALGDSAGFNITGRNNIDIGNQGITDESDTIRIGTVGTQTATYIAGINGAMVAGGVGVVIDTQGHLGTIVSSGRFKDNVKPMGEASEEIFSLEPVTFRYKKYLDPQGSPQFGLVAEEVEKVNPDLVVRDDQGKPYTVRYEAVNAMLLNEFLKEHRKVEEQSSQIARQDYKVQTLETTVTNQQTQIELLATALKAQAAQIQKVSDQLRHRLLLRCGSRDNSNLSQGPRLGHTFGALGQVREAEAKPRRGSMR